MTEIISRTQLNFVKHYCGIKVATAAAYPSAEYQRCIIHLSAQHAEECGR